MRLDARRVAILVAAVLIGLAATPAAAQEFPTKPIELVLPFGAGGSHDLTARAVASVAQPYLGQPLLVVLKPGGGGAVGSPEEGIGANQVFPRPSKGAVIQR